MFFIISYEISWRVRIRQVQKIIRHKTNIKVSRSIHLFLSFFLPLFFLFICVFSFSLPKFRSVRKECEYDDKAQSLAEILLSRGDGGVVGGEGKERSPRRSFFIVTASKCFSPSLRRVLSLVSGPSFVSTGQFYFFLCGSCKSRRTIIIRREKKRPGLIRSRRITLVRATTITFCRCSTEKARSICFPMKFVVYIDDNDRFFLPVTGSLDHE